MLLAQLPFPAIRGRLAPRVQWHIVPSLGEQHSLPRRQVLAIFRRACTRCHRRVKRLRGCRKGVSSLSLSSLASLLRSDHGFTHSASSTTVLMFRTSRFSTLSSSWPGLNIRPGAWPVPQSTVRYASRLAPSFLRAICSLFAASVDGHQARDEPRTRK